MIKTGITLLSTSSLGVLYRTADLAYSMNLALKWFCLIGLSLALACFAAVYLQAEIPKLRKRTRRSPDMIKSPEWKYSSMA